jgi:hemin uptake protein HemP
MSSETETEADQRGQKMIEKTEQGVRVVDARTLLGERGLLRIDLDGELYTLRRTRKGRLILTK